MLAGVAGVRGLQQGVQVRHVDLLSAGRDGATPTQPRKAKRTLGFDNLFKMLAAVLASSPVLLAALFRPKISAALREKVMLGVTAINDCRYCAWGHAHWAVSQGVSLDDVNQILSSQLDSLKANSPAEAAAILFGQHYAEHLGEIDPESLKNLRKYFTQSQVREIVGYVYFITFTNLSGNTVDAVLERVRGPGRPITVVEGISGVVLAPILLLLVVLVKAGKLIGTDRRRAKRHRPAQVLPRDSGGTHTL
jgi:AhpD family alkylhydroperoxidase